MRRYTPPCAHWERGARGEYAPGSGHCSVGSDGNVIGHLESLLKEAASRRSTCTRLRVRVIVSTLLPVFPLLRQTASKVSLLPRRVHVPDQPFSVSSQRAPKPQLLE